MGKVVGYGVPCSVLAPPKQHLEPPDELIISNQTYLKAVDLMNQNHDIQRIFGKPSTLCGWQFEQNGETLSMLVTSVAPSSTSISRIYQPFLYFPCFLKPQNALSVVFSLFSLNKKTS